MLLAAMLAMVLAAAAPALAQGDVGDVNQGDDQFNECLNAFFASASATAAADVQYHAATGSATASATATALPATGGMVPSSVLALGAGALLVGGGLLARRIVR